jgi:hypothetical protein
MLGSAEETRTPYIGLTGTHALKVRGQLDRMCGALSVPKSSIRQTQWLSTSMIIPGTSDFLHTNIASQAWEAEPPGSCVQPPRIAVYSTYGPRCTGVMMRWSVFGWQQPVGEGDFKNYVLYYDLGLKCPQRLVCWRLSPQLGALLSADWIMTVLTSSMG